MMRPTHEQSKAATQSAAMASKVRTVISALALFAGGAAVSAYYFMRAPAPALTPQGVVSAELSGATREVLHHLNSPVEIRFYCLLDPATVGGDGQAFSARVDEMLSRFEQESGGRITIARIISNSISAAEAASADGIKPFNLDKGDACYLGIAVVCGGHIETLSSLSPAWEQALEPDLSRALARALATDSPATPGASASPAALAAVRQLIPNVVSISVEEGANVLRQTSYDQFKKEVEEMQAQVKQANDRFLQAEADHSEEGQEAARKELQQIQADHLVNLRRLTTGARAQSIALQQLKATSQ